MYMHLRLLQPSQRRPKSRNAILSLRYFFIERKKTWYVAVGGEAKMVEASVRVKPEMPATE
jgi:hypothetical protein